ncbi:hypothetical protein SCHPADRAFT_896112 [Schizopora paradoxa]|uniref:Uncharacterized protein n=1 Tax=Schizopora paradoxa TaxID=27342 RepID=A0A0H2R1K7_9AGAM|nr:hypothetical protein SCHPADRAFT_896112 [Schizopora paradoxa]
MWVGHGFTLTRGGRRPLVAVARCLYLYPSASYSVHYIAENAVVQEMIIRKASIAFLCISDIFNDRNRRMSALDTDSLFPASHFTKNPDNNVFRRSHIQTQLQITQMPASQSPLAHSKLR